MNKQSSGFSVASMLLGIIGLLLGCVIVGFIPAVIGLILGIVALAKGSSGKGMAIAGVVCSIIGILISAVILFMPSSSTTSGTETVESKKDSAVVSDATTSIAETPQNLADQVDSQLYTCHREDEYYYAALVVQNNSDEVVHLEVNFIAKDSDGNNVDAATDSESAIAPSQKAILWSAYDYEGDISSIDYTLTVSRESNFDSVYDDVSFEYNTTETSCIVTATNNGSESATFVRAECIFLSGGEMVSHDFTYLTDDADELKPGATITKSLDCYSDASFDDIIVTFSGRK